MMRIFSVSECVQDHATSDGDGPRCLGGLQWDSVSPTGNESNFPLMDVQLTFAGDRTFALALRWFRSEGPQR